MGLRENLSGATTEKSKIMSVCIGLYWFVYATGADTWYAVCDQ